MDYSFLRRNICAIFIQTTTLCHFFCAQSKHWWFCPIFNNIVIPLEFDVHGHSFLLCRFDFWQFSYPIFYLIIASSTVYLFLYFSNISDFPAIVKSIWSMWWTETRYCGTSICSLSFPLLSEWYAVWLRMIAFVHWKFSNNPKKNWNNK